MKKGQIYRGVAREIKFPNRAVVITDEGETCTVANALPGQIVEFRCEKAKNGRFEGRLLEVLKKSEPETVKPSVSRICARPLMLMPPIPMKCTWTGREKSI